MERVTKIGLVGLALLVALAGCSKSTENSNTTTTEASTAPEASAAAHANTMATAPAGNGVAASDGAKIYQTNCSSCHQATGAGVPGTFPPLADNPVVGGEAKQVIHIVKYGLSGKVEVLGKTYNGMMPAWGQQLSDADIAAVVTYIRSSWGNKGAAVTEADVKAVTQ